MSPLCLTRFSQSLKHAGARQEDQAKAGPLLVKKTPEEAHFLTTTTEATEELTKHFARYGSHS